MWPGFPLLIPGVQLEPKGLSTTIHFRRADPTARDQIETIVRSLVPADHPDLMVTEGLMNYEIRPRLDWNKGSAVRWVYERIKDRAALAFVIGDDRTDEDAFPSSGRRDHDPRGSRRLDIRSLQLAGPRHLGDLLGWLLELWKDRLDSADPASQPHIRRPALALKESSPILNVRLRRAAVDRRRQASR